MLRCSHGSHSRYIARCAPEAMRVQMLRSSRRRPGSFKVVCGAATASMKTHYDVLGVRDSASLRDIKDAFRRLALVWHPDQCKQPGAEETFMELVAAHATLTDLATRAKYDLQLKQAAQPPPTGPAATVKYDWAKCRNRNTNLRGQSSTRKSPQQQDGFASSAVPPRTTTRQPYGDDFDAFSRVTAGANRFDSSSHAASASGAAASSSSGRGASEQAHRASGSTFGGATSTDGVVGSSTTSAYQPNARATPPFSRARGGRSRTRTVGRTLYVHSSASPAAPPPRAVPLTPAQQWHSAYCHSGDDFVASTGTSYAATETVMRAAAYAGGRESDSSSYHASSSYNASSSGDSSYNASSYHASSSSGDSSSSRWPPVRHAADVAGNGSTLKMATDAAVPAAPASQAPVPAWHSSPRRSLADGDCAENQHATVEREETLLPVDAALFWEMLSGLLASFLPVRM